MSDRLRDRFLWVSFAKFALVLMVGLGAMVLIGGIDAKLAVQLAAGAIIGFPIAYTFGTAHPRPTA